ncbi:aldo/keto reductase [Streptomyces abyssomicinicus]|uniref:aldo/keto reductase n=1 Tax=Streptomyces abyssomicinicus TaxID=574929 RepID=UPI00248444CD|nr:aldo/keto reductase [Streptomyces abyssomicinicus]
MTAADRADRASGLPVGRVGFGAMRLPTAPGPERERALGVARRAAELGVTLVDTAFMYGWGANEELLADALHPYPEGLLIATKVGIARSDGPEGWAHDGRPGSLRRQAEQALRRLRLDRIELLQLHRLDPAVPVAEQVGALGELRAAGLVHRIGLSEVTAEQLTEARRTAPVASVQNRYSLFSRDHERVLDACEAADIAFLPWRPVAAGDSAEVAAVAAETGATPQQVLLAWLLARSPVMLPIPGTASAAHLEENVAAGALRLTSGQRERLEHGAPPGGP